MIVLIDMGNSRVKYCTSVQGKLTPINVVDNKEFTCRLFENQFHKSSKVIIASVGDKHLTDALFDWCKANNISYQEISSEKQKNGVVNGYQVPAQLGVDRWLGLLGAAANFANKNVLIVDSGTATTIDFLGADGQHHGGWILSGINTLVTGIIANTSYVKANSNEPVSLSFGANTSENVHNAAWAATVGSVNVGISQIQHQGINLDEVVFTGGNALKLSSLINYQNKVIPALVFHGLQSYI